MQICGIRWVWNPFAIELFEWGEKKIISGSCREQHRGGFKSTMKVFYTALRAHTDWRQIAK